MNGLLTSTNLLSGNLLRSMTWGVKEMTEGGGMEGCSDDGHAAEQGHSGFEWVDQWRRKTSWLEVANIRCPKPSTQPQVGTASALRLPPQYSPEPRRVQNLTKSPSSPPPPDNQIKSRASIGSVRQVQNVFATLFIYFFHHKFRVRKIIYIYIYSTYLQFI